MKAGKDEKVMVVLVLDPWAKFKKEHPTLPCLHPSGSLNPSVHEPGSTQGSPVALGRCLSHFQ